MRRHVILMFAAIFILCAVVMGAPAWSINIGSLPYTNNFDSTTVADWSEWAAARPGDPVAYTSDPDGWSGRSGKMRFTSTGSDFYASVGWFTLPASVTTVHVRYLIYYGSTCLDHGKDAEPKTAILNRNEPYYSPPYRTLTYWDWQSGRWTYRACGQNDLNCGWAQTGETGYDVDFDPEDYEEQWICVEFRTSIDSADGKMWITTQDGTYNETQILHFTTGHQNTGTWHDVSVLGRYGNVLSSPDSNSYFKIDELKIDNSYIGPPAGFVGGYSPPSPPSGLRISE